MSESNRSHLWGPRIRTSKVTTFRVCNHCACVMRVTGRHAHYGSPDGPRRGMRWSLSVPKCKRGPLV